ncbi:MAG: biotin attachment protein, partial [Gammaproteobacteria bacterium]
LLRRYYRIRSLEKLRTDSEGAYSLASAEYDHPDGIRISAAAAHANWDDLEKAWSKLSRWAKGENPNHEITIDLFVWREGGHGDASETAEALRTQLSAHPVGRAIRRVVVVVGAQGTGRGMSALQHFTFRPGDDGFVEERVSRGLHPMMGKRLQLWRLSNFQVERLPSAEDVYLFHGVAHSNPKDERLFAFAEVRDLTPMRNEQDAIVSLPDLERQYLETLAAIRLFQSRRSARQRLHWNRVMLYVWPVMELAMDELHAIAHRLLPAAAELGLEKTVLRARIPDPESGQLRDTAIHVGSPSGHDIVMRVAPVADRPIEPLSEYGQRVVRMRQRGLVHPYELIEMLTPSDDSRTDLPPGEFEEFDLDENGALVSVERPRGGN